MSGLPADGFFGIVVDDASAPSGCSGTAVLFGHLEELDDFVQAYRAHRIAHLEGERERAEKALVGVYLEKKNAWDAHFRKEGRLFRTRLDYDEDLDGRQKWPLREIEFPLGDDGQPDTGEIDDVIVRRAETLADVLFRLQNDNYTYDGAWRRFKAGSADAQVGAAYATQRFARQINVIATDSVSLPAEEELEVLNIWGWPYWMRWESAAISIAWLEYTFPSHRGPERSFLRACKYDFTSFGMKGSFSDDYQAPWSFWGTPGLLSLDADPQEWRAVLRHGKIVREQFVPSGTLRSRLYLPDKCFSCRDEMEADVAKARCSEFVPELKNLCLAIVGDG